MNHFLNFRQVFLSFSAERDLVLLVAAEGFLFDHELEPDRSHAVLNAGRWTGKNYCKNSEESGRGSNKFYYKLFKIKRLGQKAPEMAF